ncbi:BMP family lipoprotein, partial [Haploplasma modicum]|uniref:BMP family lipoprotein n=1 Tax=Haploplasma modicum TaxID=2150 RepID=UPI00214B695B
MKKILSILAVFLLALTLVSCTGKSYEIAMITDTGDIDDGSFNQGTWEGIVKFAKENDKTHKYFKPAGESTSDYEAAIDLAVKRGAKIVITPGFYFEVPIFNAQDKYPNVKFVILDGSPHNGKKDDANVAKIGDNTLSIFFQEEQAGFLAGYAAVLEGFTKLGYMGGIPVPAVQRFGIGWIAGAYYAAKEKNLTEFNFSADYYEYLNDFAPNDQFKTKGASWYSNGIEIIHVAAGGAGSSIMAAAKDASSGATKKWVVGVDSDQAKDSETVISSAVKGVGEAAEKALKAFYEDKFPGKTTWNLGANDQAVGLPQGDSFRFKTFKVAQYDAIFAKLVAKTVDVPTTADELATFVDALGIIYS